MIHVYLTGGIGSRLHQYAFALATAKSLGTTFSVSRLGALSPFHLGGLGERIGFCFKRIAAQTSRWISGWPYFDWTDQSIPWATCLGDVQDSAIYEGYFQSELYFKDAIQEIKQAFTIRAKHRRAYLARWAPIMNHRKVLVLHLRRGDYLFTCKPTLGLANLCLPDSYFLSALDQFPDLDSYQIICVSNGLTYAKQLLGSIQPQVIFSDSTSIVDFQILQHAEAIITSNSSFSWWGAYLNQNPNKRIIAPKHWLGFKVGRDYPSEIVPHGWEIIETGYTGTTLKAGC